MSFSKFIVVDDRADETQKFLTVNNLVYFGFTELGVPNSSSSAYLTIPRWNVIEAKNFPDWFRKVKRPWRQALSDMYGGISLLNESASAPSIYYVKGNIIEIHLI